MRGSRWVVVAALATLIAIVVVFPRAGLAFAVGLAMVTLLVTAATRRRRARSLSRAATAAAEEPPRVRDLHD